ncbi:MAG TPA: hypothetical protein VHW09_27060 [Bryobacteraceae bacterium]|jgi:hypothetical protein|nr:hypothetical protein [Bryobacteraceae bacterium]
MSLETAKLLRIVEALHDALLEIQVGGDMTRLIGQMTEDFKDPKFQRGFLTGLERALRTEGMPSVLSGEGAQRIVAHINRIGMTFQIAEKEAAHAG